MPTPRARSPFDRRRWSTEDAREVIASLEHSGQSVGAFAAEHGVDPQRIYLWRRRLGRTRSAGSTFRELVVRPAAAEYVHGPFEIVVASGTVVRVPASFDPDGLARLLEVLARAGAC